MLLKQSTARTRMFYLGSTGLTPTVTISKAGAAFAALGGSITEVSGSWYKVTLNTTDTNTLGDLAYLFSTGTMSPLFADEVVVDLPGGQVTNATGDVQGKVLGGGASSITGVGVRADEHILKNTALAAFPFTMRSSSDHVSLATGLAVTAKRSLDGAAYGACTNGVTEVGLGLYKIDLAAADLNADTVSLQFTATGADPVAFTIVTQP